MAWWRLNPEKPDGVDLMVNAPEPPADGDWVQGPAGEMDRISGRWTVMAEAGRVRAKSAAEREADHQEAEAAREARRQEKEELRAAAAKIEQLHADVAALKAKNGAVK